MPIKEKTDGIAPVLVVARPAAAERNPWRIATAALVSLTVMMALMANVFAVIYNSGRAGSGKRDFVAYWAAAQQLVRGDNPYQPSLNPHLDHTLGWETGQLPTMLNPPVIFWLVAPLGMLGPRLAVPFWLALLAVCLAASIWITWNMNGRLNGKLYLLGFCFAPAIYCLMAGQIGVFLLLGVTLFLWLHNSNPFFAGAALVFCAMKPHLFVPFGLVLVLWALMGRRCRILAGFAAALVSSIAFAFWLDPHAWLQWEQMARGVGVMQRHTPTFGSLLRFIVNPESTWLQFVPDVMGCVWSFWYFWKRRNSWNWMDEGLILLIVSVGCAPYSWTTDEALLLPSLLIAAQRGQNSNRSLLPFVLILSIELFELLKGAPMVGISTPFYLWTVPAYLAWYLYATRKSLMIKRSPSMVIPS